MRITIKGARVNSGLSQHDMAKRLGMSYKQYCERERHYVPFTATEIITFLSVTGFNLDDLNDDLKIVHKHRAKHYNIN